MEQLIEEHTMGAGEQVYSVTRLYSSRPLSSSSTSQQTLGSCSTNIQPGSRAKRVLDLVLGMTIHIEFVHSLWLWFKTN